MPRTEKKYVFMECPIGMVPFTIGSGAQKDNKIARRHFGHSRLRPLGLVFGDFQENKSDLKALVGRARSQQQMFGFAGSYFP